MIKFNGRIKYMNDFVLFQVFGGRRPYPLSWRSLYTHLKLTNKSAIGLWYIKSYHIHFRFRINYNSSLFVFKTQASFSFRYYQNYFCIFYLHVRTGFLQHHPFARGYLIPRGEIRSAGCTLSVTVFVI